MAEINAQKHIALVFAQAQKLMSARQQLMTAKIDAEEAEKELLRLNGTSSLDLDRFENRRFFECEGDPKIRLEFGDTPPDNEMKGCTTIVPYDSWDLPRGSTRPKELPLCRQCEITYTNKDAKPVAAEEKPKEKLPDVPF